MNPFQAYHELIVDFHRGLLRRDPELLDRILSDQLDLSAVLATDLALPLSEDIEIEGISVEGRGDLTTVYYVDKGNASAADIRLAVGVTDVNGQLKVAQPGPTARESLT